MAPKFTLPPDAPALVSMTVARIEEHGDEIRDTLGRVADGPLEMVETLTEDEKAL